MVTKLDGLTICVGATGERGPSRGIAARDRVVTLSQTRAP